MTRLARSATQLEAAAVIATALSFSVPVSIDRHEYTAAVFDYASNPSTDREASLRIEKAKNHQLTTISQLLGAGGLFMLMNFGLWLVKRRPHSEPSGSSRSLLTTAQLL
jgi:hypothetical protein